MIFFYFIWSSSASWGRDTHVQVHGLCLGIILQGRLTTFSTQAALLVTTEWNGPVDKVVHVHPRCARLEGVRHPDGALIVLGVYRSGETIVCVVGVLDDLGFVGELADGHHGTKDLLAHDLHLGLAVSEDGGLNVVATTGFLDGGSSQGHSGPFLLAGLDVTQNLVVLHLAVLRSLVRGRVEWIANLDALHPLGVCLQEFVVHVFVNIDTSAGMAGLAEVHVDAPR